MNIELKDDLVPAIVQDYRSGEVLMLGYMNQEALNQTLGSGHVTFFSRSRRKLWTKGETSGHRLTLRELWLDCDRDALLIRAELEGPGCCHLGYRSCFFRRVTGTGEEIAATRAFDPETVYAGQHRQGRERT